jgi:hypothetical protein
VLSEPQARVHGHKALLRLLRSNSEAAALEPLADLVIAEDEDHELDGAQQGR